MKKIIIGSSIVVATILIFSVGVYAAEYLKFTGDEELEESNESVNEIMDILRDVNDGKLDAETSLDEALERLEKLEDMNPPGLAKENKRLREENKRLEDEIKRANTKVSDHHNNVQGALNEAKQIGGN